MGCKKEFSDVKKWDLHYNSTHRHACQYCGFIYPSAWFLDIHVLERHDTFFKILAKKQNMYECLVRECGKKFAKNYQRQNHLIDVHKFPKSFRFHQRSQQYKSKTQKFAKTPENPASVSSENMTDDKKKRNKKKSKKPIDTEKKETDNIISQVSEIHPIVTVAPIIDTKMDSDIAEALNTVKLVDDTEVEFNDSQENSEKPIPKVISFGRRGRGRTSRMRGMQTFYAPTQKKNPS